MKRVTVRSLALGVGPETIAAPLRLTLWGPAAGTITFETQRFATALPALGSAAAPVAETYVGEGTCGRGVSRCERESRT